MNKFSETITAIENDEYGWQEDKISRLEHILERPFPISPFRLHHFWVDLQEKYNER